MRQLDSTNDEPPINECFLCVSKDRIDASSDLHIRNTWLVYIKWLHLPSSVHLFSVHIKVNGRVVALPLTISACTTLDSGPCGTAWCCEVYPRGTRRGPLHFPHHPHMWRPSVDDLFHRSRSTERREQQLVTMYSPASSQIRINILTGTKAS